MAKQSNLLSLSTTIEYTTMCGFFLLQYTQKKTYTLFHIRKSTKKNVNILASLPTFRHVIPCVTSWLCCIVIFPYISFFFPNKAKPKIPYSTRVHAPSLSLFGCILNTFDPHNLLGTLPPAVRLLCLLIRKYPTKKMCNQIHPLSSLLCAFDNIQ